MASNRPVATKPPDDDAAHREDQLREALGQRNAFRSRVNGAKVRTAEMPRDLLLTLTFGVAVDMVIRLALGELQPKTAKEAAEVARLMLAIGRTETGEGGEDPATLTDDQRAAKIARARELMDEAKARAADVSAAVAKVTPHLEVLRAEVRDGPVEAS